MCISETSHPIGFCGAKITLFAPRRVFSSRFSAPSAPAAETFPSRRAKPRVLAQKRPVFNKNSPIFHIPSAPCEIISLRARSYIIAISSTGEPYFLVNSFAFSIFFVFLPKSMSRSPRTKRTKATPRPLAPAKWQSRCACTPPTRREQGEKLPSPPPRQCKRVHKPFHSIAPIGNDTRAPQSRPAYRPNS